VAPRCRKRLLATHPTRVAKTSPAKRLRTAFPPDYFDPTEENYPTGGTMGGADTAERSVLLIVFYGLSTDGGVRFGSLEAYARVTFAASVFEN
jgi:hypothetical protein